jgi:hypothetical protein
MFFRRSRKSSPVQHEKRSNRKFRSRRAVVEPLEQRRLLALTTSISGLKFGDLNHNGNQDAGESGLSGWTIALDGTDTFLGPVHLTTSTDAQGKYNFDNKVFAGTFTISEVQQNGWVETAPPGGSYTVTVALGSTTSGLDFGNFQKASPTLSTQASAGGPEATTAVSDTATLAGGYNETGNITFQLEDASNSVLFTSIQSASGNNPVTSGSYTPAEDGTYHWVVSYAGDGNNNGPVSDPGTSLAEQVTITEVTPTLATSASPTSGTVGTAVTLSDTATLTGQLSSDAGTVTFTLTAPDASTVYTSSAFSETGNFTQSVSTTLTPTQVGTYTWHASYSDDGNITNDTGFNESVTVGKASPSIVTTASPAITLDASGAPTLSEKATLSGGYLPDGLASSITFTLTGPGGFSYTQTDTVTGNGPYSATKTLPTTGAVTGTYTWTAYYSGDADNNAANDQGGTAEQTVVSPAKPTITSTPGGTIVLGSGTKLTDSADLEGAYNPTGTITFNLYAPSDTTYSSPVDTETVMVTKNGTYSTPNGYLPTVLGTYEWIASYSGNPNNTSVSTNKGDEPETVVAPDVDVTKTADQGTILVGQTAGFTVTIFNEGTGTATGVTLSDPLPAGAANDINWKIDISGTGLAAGTNPADFQITGVVGSQTLVLSSYFITTLGDSLTAGQSISVHITGVTGVNDAGGSTSAFLGAAGNYAVLYEGTGGHNLSLTNVSVNGNVGVGGTGVVQFSGPGTINGRLDFSAANTGQYHNSNGSNIGPTSVNYSVAAVTNALNTVNSLSSSLAGLGNSLVISGNQTINESAGQLDTVGGVTYRVFNVTSYSENDGKLVTINGDGSGNPVVLNFGFSSNVNLGGDVALSGGLTDDQVLWNFTTSGKSVSLNNNASSYPFPAAFHGVILAPNDTISLVNANLAGRVFGGNSSDMQIVSGDTINAPATSATLVNTATVNATNEIPAEQNDMATAKITVVAGLVSGTVYCDANLNGVLDSGETLDAGAVVSLLSGNTVIKTATTGTNGYYQFIVAPGTYTVKMTTPTSGDTAELSHGSVIIPPSYTTTVSAGSNSSGKNFPQVDFGSISGLVFLDINDSGNFDSGDSAISGATVTLTGTNYLGNSVNLTTTTNSNVPSNFSFGNLLPSNGTGYTIQVTPPSGDLNGNAKVGTLNGVPDGTTSPCGTGTISGIVLPGCNNAAVGYSFGELGIFHGLTATIGFWHNQNGQSLLKSFGTTSGGLTLANWLATTMPNLFGAKAPAFNVNSTIGTNLTNRSDSDVASYFLSLFGVSGQKSYAQVLATAFAVFTTTNSLDTGTSSRGLAAKYGFTLSNTGAGAVSYTVPQADWPAFGITSSSSATQSIFQLLLKANSFAVKGVLNGGNSTLITETNDVFNGINNKGDIGFGMNLVAAGTDVGANVSLGQIYAGIYMVSVDGLQGSQAAAEHARILDGISQLDSALASVGVFLAEVSGDVSATADIQIHLADTSTIGGVAEGVLGVTQLGGQITIINGWNWYTGSDSGAVGGSQFDFQTVVTHELGHALGLGHSTDQASVMFPYLSTGEVRRSLTAADLSIIEQGGDEGPHALKAGPTVTLTAATAQLVSIVTPAAYPSSLESSVGQRWNDPGRMDGVFREMGSASDLPHGRQDWPTSVNSAMVVEWIGGLSRGNHESVGSVLASWRTNGGATGVAENADRLRNKIVAVDHALQSFERHDEHDHLAIDLKAGSKQIAVMSSAPARSNSNSEERITGGQTSTPSATLSCWAVAASGAIAAFLPRPTVEARTSAVRLKRRRFPKHQV